MPEIDSRNLCCDSGTIRVGPSHGPHPVGGRSIPNALPYATPPAMPQNHAIRPVYEGILSVSAASICPAARPGGSVACPLHPLLVYLRGSVRARICRWMYSGAFTSSVFWKTRIVAPSPPLSFH